MSTLGLMAVLAHPDDESLGFGGTLARYAAEGVRVSLVTATRGQAGRFRGIAPSAVGHPGRAALAAQRERELRAAAAVLGVASLDVLEHDDGALADAAPRRVIGEIAEAIRRERPDVVVTFAPDGAYGHPDHIAISQHALAAVVEAASTGGAAPTHAVRKAYVLAWPADVWAAYQSAFTSLVSRVDGVERRATPWPDWAITTTIDTRACWPTVWRAVQCHDSQIGAYAVLQTLGADDHSALWGRQSYYRVFSTVSGGRGRETDLFEGLR
ncbi:MAG: PIG-L family deacetylase [Vicinamibacterales bacterium]